MTGSGEAADEPVALIAQHRVVDAGYAAYTRWLARLVEELRSQPGYLAHEVVPPAPPEQLDWITVTHFADVRAAHRWLESPARAAALADIRGQHLLAGEEVHLMEDKGPPPHGGTSAFFAYDVPAKDEAAFLDWQAAIHAEEVRQPGFLRRKIERPVPGVRDEWIIVLTFDTDATLSRWLDSPVRKALLDKGRGLRLARRFSRTSYGFDFWFRGADAPAPGGWTILKNNLLVLLMLNPIVIAWSLAVQGPVLTAHGAPAWVGLFLGNLVGTQLLGWWFAPAAFKAFGWWLVPDAGWRRTVLGYALLAALYAATMAVYAALAS